MSLAPNAVPGNCPLKTATEVQIYFDATTRPKLYP